MSIILIVAIALVVLSAGIKLRRGTFFWWSDRNDASSTHADRRDDDDRS